MVSIEAESLCNAEYKLLEYNGVWGALAFDNKMMKTDTFAGAVQGCEMVSMEDISKMSHNLTTAKADAVLATEAYIDADDEVEKLTAMLEAAKKAHREAAQKKAEAWRAYEIEEAKFGAERR